MVVLTGAAGFIGSCLLAHFNAIGREDIIVVDHLEGLASQDQKRLKEENLKNKKYSKFFEKDQFIEKIINGEFNEKFDAIIHMGACSSTTLDDAQYFEKNNFRYSQELAKWCVAHKTRLIYASSAATYGDGELGYSDEDAITRQLKPLNLYGQSKQKLDLWILDQGLEKTFVGLKFFNVFGPNEYHKTDMRSVVAKAYPRAKQEGKISLFKSYKKEYADGEQKRDFIYVKDAVDVVMFFYNHPDVSGIYNVGTGQACTWNELAFAIFKAVGLKPMIEYIEMPEYLRPKYQYFTQADITKLNRAGYQKPFQKLEDAVSDYVRYLEKNEHM